MAVTTPAATGRMPAEGFSASRRWGIGVNVAVSIGLAIGLVVLVNWFASLQHYRRDFAAFGSVGLSDRTRTVLAGLTSDVKVTTAYLSSDPEKAREKFIDRLMTYCDELALVSPRVSVEHIATEEDKARLVRRIADHYSPESAEHQKTLADFAAMRGELEQSLSLGGNLGEVPAGDRWLDSFPIYRQITLLLEEDRMAIVNAADEVARLTGSAGLPKYGEATNKIGTALRPVKDHLTKAQTLLGQLSRLADEASKPDSGLVATLKQAAAGIEPVAKALTEAVGSGTEAPADAKGTLTAFAAAVQAQEKSLLELVSLLDGLLRGHGTLEQHQMWSVAMEVGKLGGMELQQRVGAPDLLEGVATQLRQVRQQVLDVIDRGQADQMAGTVTAIRTRWWPVIGTTLTQVQTTLTALAESLARVDVASARALEQARGGGMFSKTVESLSGLLDRVDKLPQLKLGQIADELTQDNIVVVEANSQARVVKFDEVWPIREQISSGLGSEGERPRTFNGDVAIGGAVLSVSGKKPFATVVLTSFEIEPPPQARQFMQPQNSTIPARALNALRERLKNANFEVKEWDLSKAEPPPEPAEGTANVFVFLPPAPANAPNPFMGQQPPSRTFGDAERKRVEAVLDKGSPGLFLACWEVRSAGFFGGYTTPPYAYGPMLKENWGIEVDNAHRVVRVNPDPRAPDRFSVTGEDFQYMALNGFTAHAIGAPFRTTRLITTNVCPVTKAEKVPDGVTVETVLYVPPDESFVSADVAAVIRVANAINDPEAGGVVERRPQDARNAGDLRDVTEALPVAVACTRKKDAAETRVVVLGTGQCLMDGYLDRPVLRVGGKGQLLADPPPTSNADFFVNAVHWLGRQEEWITSGPMPAPAIAAMSPASISAVRIGIWGFYPALVAACGAVAWWLRRS